MKFLQFPRFLGTILTCLDPDLESQSTSRSTNPTESRNPDKKRCQEQSEVSITLKQDPAMAETATTI
jgi:hypothetical protein